ncbi:Glutathione S-transferase 2 [Rhodotorula toruloides]
MTDSALSHGPKELQNKGLVLLLAQTPNGASASTGNKPVYLLEELKALGKIPDYTFVPVSFGKNEQKSDWFEAVNPNGRIPALLDNREGKKPIKVWESASILLYLAKTYDTDATFHFKDEDMQTELLNWIFFIQGGVGPMQGQANHFFRYAPEKIEYGIKRYQDETRRLYQIYEDHLNGTKDGERKEWLVGGKYTIADMCTQPWVRMAMWAGVELEKFPALAAWVERIEKRPATQAALKVPEQDMLSKIKNDPEYADKLAKKSSEWIMKGNESKK